MSDQCDYKCAYAPEKLDVSLGVFKCPNCGHLIAAGLPHPTPQAFSEEELSIIAGWESPDKITGV